MKRIIFAIAILPLCILPLHAQQEESDYNESVVVKGTYRPVIETSEKLMFPPRITDTIGRIEHIFNYSISPTRLRANYEPTRIRAARIKGEPTTRLYNNYLRLGFGNYWTPLADLYWSSTRDRLKTYGVRLNHLSSWGTLPQYGPNHFGNTTLTLFGKYIVKEKIQLSADVGYEHDHNLYYGFTDSTLQATLNQTRDNISLGDYRASYNVAQMNIGIRNMQLDPNKLGYEADIHIADLWGYWGQNEFNTNINGDIHYGFNIKNQYKGIAYLHLEWDHYNNLIPGNANLLGILTTTVADTFSNNLVKVNPYVDFIFRGLQFRTGINLGWDQNAHNMINIPELWLFPDVTVSKKLMKDRLVLSLAAVGGLEANSLNALRRINPYIAPDVYGELATSHYDFIGHARWTISKKLETNVEVGYSLLRNDVSFFTDPFYSLNNVFSPIYFDHNRLTAGADFAFVNDEMITLRIGGHYYHYSIQDDSPVTFAPYRPNWDAFLRADVNYLDRWLFHLETQLLGSMQGAAFNPTPTPTIEASSTLPLRYGIAAEVEYRHNRALSFFLRMDNLAFQRYMLWENYPSQRGLFLIGLTYTIPHK